MVGSLILLYMCVVLDLIMQVNSKELMPAQIQNQSMTGPVSMTTKIL